MFICVVQKIDITINMYILAVKNKTYNHVGSSRHGRTLNHLVSLGQYTSLSVVFASLLATLSSRIFRAKSWVHREAQPDPHNLNLRIALSDPREAHRQRQIRRAVRDGTAACLARH